MFFLHNLRGSTAPRRPSHTAYVSPHILAIPSLRSLRIPSSPPQKALAKQVLFSFERGASHPWLTRVVRRRLVFPAQPPLFHGAATTLPHRLRFTSHSRYSVASLLTNPLATTGANRRATFHKCVLFCSSFFRKRGDLSCAQVRRRRSRRFRPFSLPVACRNLFPKRILSSLLHHYGEYPLVFPVV